MLTEIYKQTSLKPDEFKALLEDSVTSDLREELGLKPADITPEGGVFSYRKITQEESNVYSILFPVKTEIEHYTDFLPVEVLEAYADFKKTCPRKVVSVEVWHAKDYDPDPLLVIGTREHDKYNFASEHYIVARWGDSLAPFPELATKALDIWKGKRQKAINVLKAKLNLLQTNLDTATFIDSPKHPTINDIPNSDVPF